MQGVARTLFEFSCREAFLMLLKADEPHGIGMMWTVEAGEATNIAPKGSLSSQRYYDVDENLFYSLRPPIFHSNLLGVQEFL